MSDKERIAALEEIVHNLVEIVNWIKPKCFDRNAMGRPIFPDTLNDVAELSAKLKARGN